MPERPYPLATDNFHTMTDKHPKVWGSSHDQSTVEGVQIMRGIPAAEADKLHQLSQELRRRIGRLGLDDRQRLLEMMQTEFPDSILDKEPEETGSSTPATRLTIQPGSAGNEVPVSPGGDDY